MGGGAAGRGPSGAQCSPRARRAQPRLCSPRQPSVRAFSTAAPYITSCRRAIGRPAPRSLAARAPGRRETREGGEKQEEEKSDEMVGAGGQGWREGAGGKEGGGRARGLEFLSYEQFPAISLGWKIKPSLPAVSILRRRSQRMLEELSLQFPLGPELPPRAQAGEAWEGRPGAELREPSTASRGARPSAQAPLCGLRAAA